MSKVCFPNMAGVPDCDDILAAELEAAGISVYRLTIFKDGKREVDTEIIGQVGKGHVSWGFTRAWYYWIAKGPGIPPDYAWKLHRTYGRDARVDGHCGCPSPGYKEGFAIHLYHIDTPAGLRALADTIKHVHQDWLDKARGEKEKP